MCVLWISILLTYGQVVAESPETARPVPPKADSVPLKKRPYCATSVSDEVVIQYRTAIGTAAQLLQSGDAALAATLLKRVRPEERLAAIYQHILLARAHLATRAYDKADSCLAHAQQFARSIHWLRYINKFRLSLVPNLGLSGAEKEQLFTKSIKIRHKDSLKISLLFDILNLKKFTGKAPHHSKIVAELFSIDNLDPRIDSLYKAQKANIRPGLWTAEVEMALAAYEASKGKYTSAIERCMKIPSKTKSHKLLKKMRLNHPRWRYRNKEFRKAIAYTKKYFRLYGQHAGLYLNIARSYKKMGKTDSATFWYDKHTSRYPHAPKTEEIYWARGWDEEAVGNADKAIEWYSKLLPAFKGKKRGSWAEFRIGYVLYKAKKYKAATKQFSKTAGSIFNRWSIPAAMYWHGRALEKMGKRDSAFQMFLDTYKTYPYHYYGHLSQQALKNHKVWNDSNMHRPPAFSDKQTGDWLSSLPQPKKVKRSISLYIDIEDLVGLGLDTLEFLTYLTAYRSHKADPKFLYQYANAFEEKWPLRSYKCARRLSWLIPENGWAEVPKRFLHLLNPKPFNREVMLFAKKEALPQHFIYALMKQESGFDHKISSWAGAIGLMQIMPSTGKNLAKQEKLQDFHPSMLRSPHFNIRLGTAYLRNLKKRYNQNLYFVLCNYNAGPRPTNRWRKKHGHKKIESLVEEISYWETRHYVKRVMSNYWNYNLLFE